MQHRYDRVFGAGDVPTPSPPGHHLRRQHGWIPGPGVSHGAPKFDFGKPDRAKLVQEGTALLRAGHSREPI